MDEPFSAIDAKNRVILQELLLKLWEGDGSEPRKTVVFVTHDIDEAVFLADRIVVMSSRPGTIKKIVNVELAEPRNRNNEEFLKIRRVIFNEFFAEQKIDLEYNI